MLNLEKLFKIMPHSRAADGFELIVHLNDAMGCYEINTALRQSAFLAQVAHESGELRYRREIASGAAYEGRADLGNTQQGDGMKFCGRGLLMITGRSNYAQASQALLSCDRLLDQPTLLEQPDWACHSAAWWWKKHGLNELADACQFATITRKINGGLKGYDSRTSYYLRAKKALNASSPVFD